MLETCGLYIVFHIKTIHTNKSFYICQHGHSIHKYKFRKYSVVNFIHTGSSVIEYTPVQLLNWRFYRV